MSKKFLTASDAVDSFWDSLHESNNEHAVHCNSDKSHNEHNATVRSMFNEHIDGLERDGRITRECAENVTLDSWSDNDAYDEGVE